MHLIKALSPLLLLSLHAPLGSASAWKSAYNLTVATSSLFLRTGTTAVGNLASHYGLPAAVAAKKAFTEQLPKAASEAATWTSKNPGSAIGAAMGAAGLITVAAPAAVALPVLSLVGFSAGGVQLGSLAAGAQAVAGNVALGSLFATAQSAAMGGAGMVAVAGVTQVCGGVVAAAGGGSAYMQSKASL